MKTRTVFTHTAITIFDGDNEPEYLSDAEEHIQIQHECGHWTNAIADICLFCSKPLQDEGVLQ